MQISGLSSSGIDVNSIVSQLMTIERKPLEKMELKKELTAAKSSIYSDIKSRIESLKGYAYTLTNESSFNVFNAVYSKESVISASIGATASKGSYSITVSELAKAHTIGSDRQTGIGVPLNFAGSIKINGKDITINLSDTLQNIMSRINSTADVSVNATIVDNVLKLKMNETGVSQISLADDPATHVLRSLGILVLTGGIDVIKNEFVAASNSKIIVDGQNIEKTSNEISDIIPGVTLNLIVKDTVTLTVSKNNSSIISNIQNFVNQYNSLVDFIYSKTSEAKVVSPASQADYHKGLVSGDSFLDGIRHGLSTLILGVVNGINEGGNSLAKIGINKTPFSSGKTNTDLLIGKLNVDTAKLTEALDKDFDSVKNLFIKNASTYDLEDSDYGVAVRIEKYIAKLTDLSNGFFAAKSTGFSSEAKILESNIASFNRRMDLKEAGLKKKYLALESAISSSDTQTAWLTAQLGSL
jgi:flagellar hook-associated protein 2